MKSSREVTIYDLAKVLGLSPSTVSRGLNDHAHINEETIDRIKTAALNMGYQKNKFASNLRQKHTNTIGVIVPKLNSYFMATVIAGMEKVTNQNGYGLIISQSQESWVHEISCLTTLFNSRVDGFLVSLAYDTQNTDHFNILTRKSIPLIFFDRVAPCSDCTSVVIDNFRAGYEATSHLIDQGCKRIVHIGGNLHRNVYSERLEGYKKALSDNRIELDNSLVFITDLSGPSAADVVRKVISMKLRPDGIFTANDTSGVAVIIELQNEGIKIPEEIAVIGFNNEPVSKVVNPNLSTIDYPALEIGELAATSLISKLKGGIQSDNLSTIVLKHNLIIRESSLRRNKR